MSGDFKYNSSNFKQLGISFVCACMLAVLADGASSPGSGFPHRGNIREELANC